MWTRFIGLYKSQQDRRFCGGWNIDPIGATTENPYFEVNGALISRFVIFELKPLSVDDIKALIRRAVCDDERGMGSYGAEITDEAVDFLADMSGGDARMALNAVELGVLTTEPQRMEDPYYHGGIRMHSAPCDAL